MSSCLESEALVTLASISDDPEGALRHVLECGECRASISDLAHLRSEFAGSRLRVGFVDEVMAALPATDTPAPRRRRSHLWWLAEGALAAGAAVLVAAAAGSASPGALGPTVLPLAGLVGLAVAARSLIPPLLRLG